MMRVNRDFDVRLPHAAECIVMHIINLQRGLPAAAKSRTQSTACSTPLHATWQSWVRPSNASLVERSYAKTKTPAW